MSFAVCFVGCCGYCLVHGLERLSLSLLPPPLPYCTDQLVVRVVTSMDYVVRALHGDGADTDFGTQLAVVHASYSRLIPLFSIPTSALIEISTSFVRC